jgi:hypothetical protein
MPHRVLLAPHEVAGQVALSAHALRLAGVDATAYTQAHPFDYGVRPDATIPPGRLRPLLRAAQLVRDHDAVHFQFGVSFLPEYARLLDARLVRRLKRGRVLVTFWGSDVRRPSVERARNPHYVDIPGEEDARAEALLRRWSTVTAGHVVCPDAALLAHVEPFFAHVHRSRAMVDVSRYEPRPPSPRTNRPIVIHSPTNRVGKGTAHVRAAVGALEREGLDFDYRELTGLTQQQALAAYAEADLIVDQLLVGAHGVFAIEAMSLAKPVIGDVRFAAPHLPDDLPIIQAGPDSIRSVLADWIRRPEDRHETGLRGRAYAEREHDVHVVGRQLAALYDELWRPH